MVHPYPPSNGNDRFEETNWLDRLLFGPLADKLPALARRRPCWIVTTSAM
jgi:hypothetical protein